MKKSNHSKTVFFNSMFKPVLSLAAASLFVLASPDMPGADSEVFGDEAQLPGVFYDMKQTSDGMPTYLMETQDGKQFNRLRTWLSVWNLPDTSGKESVLVPFLKRFVLSNWPYRTDSTGSLIFREFSNFSRSPITPYRSFFYQPFLSSDTAPKIFSNDTRVSGAGWVGIHSGYVVAPFTGTFRFVGYGDDALVVRFDNQLVLDYGCYALSLGKKLDGTWDYFAILSGAAARTDPQRRPVLDNPIYSRCKLELYFPSLFNNHGLAKGVPVKVTKGRHYPIEILVSDIEHNQFGMALFMECLDSDGKPLKENPSKLPLFRTTSELPKHSGDSFPDFEEDSPIWRVVDSQGKPIPSRNPAASDREMNSDSTASPQEKTSAELADRQKNDSNPVRTVSTTTQGNITTETVVEQRGDTTVETVTTTEVKGDSTFQTAVITEKKNGVIVKKTTSTSSTMIVEFFPNPSADGKPRESEKTDAEPSSASPLKKKADSDPKPEKTDAESSGGTSASPPEKKTDSSPSPKKEKRNPFGYTQNPFDSE